MEGLAGAKTLEGVLPVYGAKNAALQAFAFSLLFEDELILDNVPDIEDTHHMLALLGSAGSACEREGERKYRLRAAAVPNSTLSYEL